MLRAVVYMCPHKSFRFKSVLDISQCFCIPNQNLCTHMINTYSQSVVKMRLLLNHYWHVHGLWDINLHLFSHQTVCVSKHTGGSYLRFGLMAHVQQQISVKWNILTILGVWLFTFVPWGWTSRPFHGGHRPMREEGRPTTPSPLLVSSNTPPLDWGSALECEAHGYSITHVNV